MSSSEVSARPGSVILRASQGEVAEALLVFQAGFAVGPFSLGQQGDWQVRANGVADLHLYLWFDGLTLYASRLHGRPEALANGEPLGEDWCPLADSTELLIGDAKITVSSHSAVLASVGESVQPEPDAHNAATGDVPPPNERTPGVLERAGLARNRRPTLRAILLLSCLPVLLVLWFAMTRPSKADHKPAATPRRPPPAAESSVRQPSAIDPELAPTFTSGAKPRPPPGGDSGVDERSAQPPPTVTRAGFAALERRAVDAVISGDFRLGAELYEKLSALAPNSKVFRVARRISARKVTGDPSAL